MLTGCCCAHRSLSAAEQLSKAGYGTIAWVNGGLDTSKKTDLPVTGADDLRYGGIGGMSEALGWTDVQREKSAGFMGGSFGPIKVVSRPAFMLRAYQTLHLPMMTEALGCALCMLAVYCGVTAALAPTGRKGYEGCSRDRLREANACCQTLAFAFASVEGD